MQLNKAESPALCFRSGQDAIDYAHHVVQDANRRLALQSLDALDSYVKGDTCLVLRAYFARNSGNSDLVFFRVPSGVSGCQSPNEALEPRVNLDLRPSVGKGLPGALGEFDISDIELADIKKGQSAMLVGVTELVQGPDGVIPSLVRLEAPKQREDFRWQILAAAAANYGLEAGGVVREGKLTSFRIRYSGCSGASVATLVQDCAEIIGGVKDDVGQIGWKPPLKDDLMRLMGGIVGVGLSPVGPWLVTDKLVDFGIEIVDVMLCAQNRAVRAFEEVSHGWQSIRSDERP